jgi:hypothetical protein
MSRVRLYTILAAATLQFLATVPGWAGELDESCKAILNLPHPDIEADHLPAQAIARHKEISHVLAARGRMSEEVFNPAYALFQRLLARLNNEPYSVGPLFQKDQIRRKINQSLVAINQFALAKTYSNYLTAGEALIVAFLMKEQTLDDRVEMRANVYAHARAGRHLVWFTDERQTVQSILEAFAGGLHLSEFSSLARKLPGDYAAHDFTHIDQIIRLSLNPAVAPWLEQGLIRAKAEEDPLLRTWLLLTFFSLRESTGFDLGFIRLDRNYLIVDDSYNLGARAGITSTLNSYWPKVRTWLEGFLQDHPFPNALPFNGTVTDSSRHRP